VHVSLRVELDACIKDGWRKHVGRDPRPDDFLFPDADGEAFREERCKAFVADVAMAGCETIVKGIELDIYSLPHMFRRRREAGWRLERRARPAPRPPAEGW
jgi:hypothetical protein